MKIILIVILSVFIKHTVLTQKRKNIALISPMSWNSWNYFEDDINEEKIKSIADAITTMWWTQSGNKRLGRCEIYQC